MKTSHDCQYPIVNNAISEVIHTINYSPKTITIGDCTFSAGCYASQPNTDGSVQIVTLARELRKVYGEHMKDSTLKTFNIHRFLFSRLEIVN